MCQVRVGSAIHQKLLFGYSEFVANQHLSECQPLLLITFPEERERHENQEAHRQCV